MESEQLSSGAQRSHGAADFHLPMRGHLRKRGESLSRLLKNYFPSPADAKFRSGEKRTDPNRMFKKPVSKARGSEAAGAYSCT